MPSSALPGAHAILMEPRTVSLFDPLRPCEASDPSFPGSTPFSVERSRSDTRAQFTAGLDLPIPIGKHFALLPTGRVHVISRGRLEPFHPLTDTLDDAPLGHPSSVTYRLGPGARLDV